MIYYNNENNSWILETNNTAYVIGISKEGLLLNTYYGEKLPFQEDYPCAQIRQEWSSFSHSEGQSTEEYSAWGGPRYNEPCLKAILPGGNRNLEISYHSYSINDNILTINLSESKYPLTVSLYYEVFEDCDIIKKYSVIKNNGDNSIKIDQILSGTIYPRQADNYRLTHLCGRWIGESSLRRDIVPEAKITLESRRGFTSHHANPWFALDENSEATEKRGNVYFGALGYSGNWKITVEKDNFKMIKVSAGIHDFDFSWDLESSTEFKTPPFYSGFTNNGFGSASRNLHKYQLSYLNKFNTNNGKRKILYNSWEATYFNIDEQGQKDLADIAASIGIELFVMDDGWFGERHSDKAGLGDWVVNKSKFPNGLSGLINHVNSLGMDFGLWVEPEMVNPDSDLYRKHPNWVYHFPESKRTEMRNQLVLNTAQEDVKEYIFQFMDKLLSENNIKFIKWDLNRSITEPGWPDAPTNKQQEIWVRHIYNLYDIVKKLKEKHTDVIFQSCSGGGGRSDMGVLEIFDQVWPSDNTDALDRLKIQEGFSYAYNAKIMEAWVTDEHNWVNNRILPLEYRFHSSMMGNLGIGADLTKWTDEDKKVASKLISEYKEIRETVQNGDLYRLRSPEKYDLSALNYVNSNQTESVLFVFLKTNQFAHELPNIFPEGLSDNTIYEVHGTGFENMKMSGKALSNIGIPIKFNGDFQSKIIKIKKA